MRKQRGFTLVELILALLISAILAGIVIEIIAGPIKSYFWVTQRAFLVQEAELALDLLEKEINQALPQTIVTTVAPNRQSVAFNKIIDTGFANGDNKEVTSFIVLTKLDESIQNDKIVWINVPDDRDPNKLYQAKFIKEQDVAHVVLNEKIFLKHNKDPFMFYVVSELITYDCDAKDHKLTRLVNNEIALINNQIKACHFDKTKDQHPIVFVNLEVKSLSKEPITLVRPVYVGDPL